MHCHLFVPDLIPRPSIALEVCRDLALPALETLLARSPMPAIEAGSVEDWLCRTFRVTKQRDWPIAPITLAADGGDPGGYFWLRADPVHLRVARDEIILADSGTFRISQAEAMALTDALNRHYREDGMIFYPMRPDRWYLRLEQPAEIETRPLPEVTGKNIDEMLPCGPDSMHWRVVLNEVQMLLYSHPVNATREAEGVFPVNSVWFWGGGKVPEVAREPGNQVWANDELVRSLARAAESECGELPADAASWLATKPAPGEHLIFLDTLRGAAQYGDHFGWREGMTKLEAHWFAPLLDALRARRIERLTLTAGQERHSLRFSVARGELWKFWRRAKPLATYAFR